MEEVIFVEEKGKITPSSRQRVLEVVTHSVHMIAISLL